MDHASFDRLTRVLGRGGTRRAAIGAVFGAGLLGANEAHARRRVGKRRKRAHAAPLRQCPNPGPGQDLSNCDFVGQDLRGTDLRGSDLRGAVLANANLCSVDLSGASVKNANFTHAVLTRANLSGTNLSSATLGEAIFCQTRMPDGTRNDSDCPPDGSDVCCDDAECDAGELCHRSGCEGTPPGSGESCIALNGVCSLFWGPSCCQYNTAGYNPIDQVGCGVTIVGGLVTTCDTGCKSQAECADKLGSPNVTCSRGLTCVSADCCYRELVGDCAECAGTCCPVGQRTSQCCLQSETCLPFSLGCGT